MTSSVSSNINHILPIDWLPSRQAGDILPTLDSAYVYRIMQKSCSLYHMINPLLTKLVRSRWLDIGVVHFYVHKLAGKNLANIQRSSPHASPIIHSHRPCTNFSFNEQVYAKNKVGYFNQ